MIPKETKPFETAILLLWKNGMTSKQIASELHYKKVQPVSRVIKKWKNLITFSV
jgi:hypothetical protein